MKRHIRFKQHKNSTPRHKTIRTTTLTLAQIQYPVKHVLQPRVETRFFLLLCEHWCLFIIPSKSLENIILLNNACHLKITYFRCFYICAHFSKISFAHCFHLHTEMYIICAQFYCYICAHVFFYASSLASCWYFIKSRYDK